MPVSGEATRRQYQDAAIRSVLEKIARCERTGEPKPALFVCDRDESDASFLVQHYSVDYFTHIVLDECNRSAWGKWSEGILRNPSAKGQEELLDLIEARGREVSEALAALRRMID